jgi:fimbrial chaperone protein
MPELERGRAPRATTGGRAWGMLLLFLASAGTSAASLQVAPTSLQLTPRQNAEALWISNSGTAPVDVQARVYRWTQRDGRDTLDPTTELVVSPPMQSLAAGQQQLIRVVRADPTPPPAQLAYRVIVDEVPTLDPGRQGMQFVLRYSLPVFIQPEGDLAPTPDLQARVLPEADGRLVLEVHNRGTGHAQLADLAVGSPQQPQIFQPGLVGYVLSGQTMRWPLDITAARMAGATLSAKINGASDPTPLSPTPPAR